jgi:hypothetical protein
MNPPKVSLRFFRESLSSLGELASDAARSSLSSTSARNGRIIPSSKVISGSLRSLASLALPTHQSKSTSNKSNNISLLSACLYHRAKREYHRAKREYHRAKRETKAPQAEHARNILARPTTLSGILACGAGVLASLDETGILATLGTFSRRAKGEQQRRRQGFLESVVGRARIFRAKRRSLFRRANGDTCLIERWNKHPRRSAILDDSLARGRWATQDDRASLSAFVASSSKNQSGATNSRSCCKV